MALQTPLYVRIVTQDRDRGYMLLVGYERTIVQRTASQVITLSCITRESLNKMLAHVEKTNNASKIIDVTAPAIHKQLVKLFGEDKPKQEEQT